MLAGDKDAAKTGSIAVVFLDAACQRYTVHFCRDVLAKVSKSWTG